jgi:hypothetical protein
MTDVGKSPRVRRGRRRGGGVTEDPKLLDPLKQLQLVAPCGEAVNAYSCLREIVRNYDLFARDYADEDAPSRLIVLTIIGVIRNPNNRPMQA